MTPNQVVAVALRLLAVWLGIEALIAVPSLFMGGVARSPPYVYALFILGITAFFMLALWFFPHTIAGKILPSQGTGSPPSATPDTWLAMGCSLIGLWILTITMPRIVLDIYALTWPGIDEDSSVKRSMFYHLAEVAIALWLVLGGKGFRKLFWWAQNAGTNKAL
jgi:hypothetical protein